MSESANCEEQREEPTELEEAGGAEVGLSKTLIVPFSRCVVTPVAGPPRYSLPFLCPDVYYAVNVPPQTQPVKTWLHFVCVVASWELAVCASRLAAAGANC